MIDPRENLKAYLDKELPRLEAEEVRRALGTDPALAAEAERYLAISVALRQEVPVPVQGMDEVLSALKKRPVQPRLRLTWVWGSAAVAMTAVVIVFANLSRLNQDRISDAAVASMSVEKAAAPAENKSLMMGGRMKQDQALSHSAPPKMVFERDQTKEDQSGFSLRTKSVAVKTPSADTRSAATASDKTTFAKAKNPVVTPVWLTRLTQNGAIVQKEVDRIVVIVKADQEAKIQKIWKPKATLAKREALKDGMVRLTLRPKG